METIDNPHSPGLKVYLKIKPTSVNDKIFFNISENQKFITLIGNKTRNNKSKPPNSDKIKIDYNKIFKNEENSYIYEEIMLNTVNESLKGKNFTFISYGDSKSEKLSLMIGSNDCYDNIAQRGLFPRLLTAIIDLIDSKEELCNNISISLSYFIILNDGRIIDLCQLIGLIGKNNKIETNCKEKFTRQYAKEIKNNSNYLKHIKKLPCENAKDALFMLLQFINFLDKFGDDNNMSNQFLQLNYFNTIIYITDNNGKNISTLSFIILPCNDIIINTKNNYNNNQVKEYNKVINDIYSKIENSDSNNKNNSLLVSFLENISFNSERRKYVIIGSVCGFYNFSENATDTLLFLNKCKELYGKNDDIDDNKSDQQLYENNGMEDCVKGKLQQVKDLEIKIATQKSKIEELNKLMDLKDDNTKSLLDNYKVQTQTIKELLGFKGDIAALLNKQTDSEENEFLIHFTTTQESIRLKDIKINELKDQIKKLTTEKDRLKNLIDTKSNDNIMVQILRNVQNINSKKKGDEKYRNDEGMLINELTKKNKQLLKDIEIIKNERDKSAEILKNFQNAVKICDNFEIEKITMSDIQKKIEKIRKKND